MNPDKELPMLAGIASVIRWFEALINLLSGPCLTLALLVSVADIATNNLLTRSVGWLLIAWSLCVAVGLDAQIMLAWDKVGVAFREHRYKVVAGYVAVGLTLGYVGFIAAAVFGFQHALGYSEAQALGLMGVNPQAYQYSRAALAVLLVALSAINRYHPKQQTLADKKAELTETLELLPLQQQVQTLRATGAVNVARAVGNAAVGRQVKAKKPTNEKPPTGPGSPTIRPIPMHAEETSPVQLMPATAAQPGRKVARAKLTLRDKVFRHLDTDPTLSKSDLARKLRCSESVASKYKSEWLQAHSDAVAR